jgi:hypothetical protein
VSFEGVAFAASSNFVNAELKSVTSFEGATFKTVPPEFFNAKLHQGTVWRGNIWPPTPNKKYEAEQFIDAYACLKLEMDRLKKHEDELDFFALEMQSRRVLLGPWRGRPIWLYGALSGYGRSYMRPLGALFVVVAIGAGAFWYFDAERTYGEALGLSAANTLNAFGFRRDFGLAIDTPLAWLQVLAAIQTILGTILLFLIWPRYPQQIPNEISRAAFGGKILNHRQGLATPLDAAERRRAHSHAPTDRRQC